MSVIGSLDPFQISTPAPQANPTAAPSNQPNVSNGLWNIQHIQSPYGVYSISVKYTWNNGIVQGPVMGSVGGNAIQGGGTLIAAKMISYAAPFGTKEVVWAAKRSGMPPLKPYPLPSDPNVTLSWMMISPMESEIQGDSATYDYKCAGHYIYYLAKPINPTIGNAMTNPIAPYDGAFSQGGNAPSIQSSDFVTGLF